MFQHFSLKIAALCMLAAWQAFLPASLGAQSAKPENLAYYWVVFRDKAESPYSVERPEEFLSPRAIARRAQFGISITEEDFPVTPHYLRQLGEQGAKVRHSSRWLNAATVLMPPDSVDKLRVLPYVDSVVYVGRYFPPRQPVAGVFDTTSSANRASSNAYGYAQRQIDMLKGTSLHQLGYRGRDVWIGVLDGGFINVDKMPFFDSIRLRRGFGPHYDFVDGNERVFEASSHGSKVLSVMGANYPGIMVGVAPDANYVCIKTEDVRGEYRVEECNWVAGLEYADSLGLDLVNSSLGYTQFSDEAMNYTYTQLDGQSSVASLAAAVAFRKGMIIVNSAGNEGATKWRHIGIPADSKYVLAVGATDASGKRASFSSLGPTADGRVKPDVVAQGQMVAVASTNRLQIQLDSGTSFASPIICGLVACLWQAFPDVDNAAILEAIRYSAHQAERPDNEMGYGIPDFQKAYEWLLKHRQKE
jgi:serine protease AprX